MKTRYLLAAVMILNMLSFAEKWGKISYVVGSAKIIRNGRERIAKVNGSINVGDRITTGDESTIDISKKDGSATIKIKENSDIIVEASSTDGNTHASLLDGKVFSNLKKIMSGREFRITTATATATIRGTAFSFSYAKASAEAVLKVFKGTVELRAAGQLINVGAGKKARVIGQALRHLSITKGEVQSASDEGGEALEGVEMPEGTEIEEEIESFGEMEEPAPEALADPPAPATEEPIEEPEVVQGELGKVTSEEVPQEVASLPDVFGEVVGVISGETGTDDDDASPAAANNDAGKKSIENIIKVEIIEAGGDLAEALENVGGGPAGVVPSVVVPQRKVIFKVYAE